MNITMQYDNFIGIYDNAFSDKQCDDLIQHFEWCNNNNRSYNRPESESVKKDTSCNLNPTNACEIGFSNANIEHMLSEFNNQFWNVCYKDYLDKYSVLADYGAHTIYSYKIQKTLPSGGYHVWHCEDAIPLMSRRVGVYILYLNDIEDGGETEFLYLSKRVKPRKGRLLVFPPNFPWAHRGNPPLSGEKYIMTGWMEFK
jgi:hypothetical protein